LEERHASKPVSHYAEWAKESRTATHSIGLVCGRGLFCFDAIVHHTKQEEEAGPEAEADDGTPLPSTIAAKARTTPPQPLLARPFSRPNWALTVGSLVYGLVSTFFRAPIVCVRCCEWVGWFVLNSPHAPMPP
jgi:hypothetical protein